MISQRRRLQSLIYSIYDGFFYSCMVGFGESYFSAYALFLGANEFQIGLLTGIPPLFAGLSQLLTQKLNQRVPSRRLLVAGSVFIQALIFIPVFASFFIQNLRIEFYILFVTLYFVSGQIVGPVWNSWMGDLVKGSQMGGYFGRRNRVITMGTFACITLGGFWLRYNKDINWELRGFGVIFLAALICRLISFLFLMKKADPLPLITTASVPSGFGKFIKTFWSHRPAHLMVFMSAMNFGVYLTAAYFTPLVLKQYQFSYTTYTAVISATALTKFLSFSFWGDLCDAYGPKKMLRISGGLMPFIMLPWILSQDPLHLVFTSAFTGFVWAGYELSTFMLLLDLSEPESRVQVSSYLNIFTSVSGFLGSLIGASAFRFAPAWISPYIFVFGLGGLWRALAVLVLSPRIPDSIVTKPVKAKEVFLKATGFKSVIGFTSRLVVFPKKPNSKDS
ncbi:MAG: MFS transporter [Oligoflexia bacterium]|nr:MFS transporter [Oligoflexia bacterium]